MKVLTLSIKRKFFDEILAGTKTTETREIRPSNENKYVVLVNEAGEKLSVNEWRQLETDEEAMQYEPMLIKYDALKLLTGAYNVSPRPYIVVEVKDVEDFIATDDNGTPYTYEYEGETCYYRYVEYKLGKIIEDKSNI